MSRIDTMKLAKKAGFEGVMVGADGEMIRETYELGLERMCGISCSTHDFAGHLLVAHSTNSKRVNVQFLDHDTPPKVAVEGWLKLERFAQQLGVTVDLEVHRDPVRSHHIGNR